MTAPQPPGPGRRARRSPDLGFLAYNLLLVLALPELGAWLLAHQLSRRKWRQGWAQRLGLLPRSPAGRRVVWAHAVSVGETMALASIVRALRARAPEAWILVTTVTDTGQEIARRECQGVADHVGYLPFDLLPCVWLALRRVRPAVCMLTETELWPNLLYLAGWAGVRLVVVNGRFSDRNLRRLRWPLAAFYRRLVGRVDRFGMQSAAYAERVISLGADPQQVQVLGNAKLDTALAQAAPDKVKRLAAELQVQEGDRVLVAGSTHASEEEIVLEAFAAVLKREPDCRLVLAPRHPARAEQVGAVIEAAGLRWVRRSNLPGPGARQVQVILLDTMGELGACYALGAAAFIGGSFIALGGHNVLEPVAVGKPVVYGPRMHGQRELERVAREAGVGFAVSGAAEIAERWLGFLEAPELREEMARRAAAVMREHRGAAERYAQVVAEELVP